MWYHVCVLPDGTVTEWCTNARYTWVIAECAQDSFGGGLWMVERKCHDFTNAAVEYRRRVNVGMVAGVNIALLPCLIEEQGK